MKKLVLSLLMFLLAVNSFAATTVSVTAHTANTTALSATENTNNSNLANAINTHNAATTGEHGVTGTMVGNSDTITFSNKSTGDFTWTSGAKAIFGNAARYIKDNTSVYAIEFGTHTVIPATSNLYLDGGVDTYIEELAANTIAFWCGGTEAVQISSTNFLPVGTGVLSTGSASDYWNDISYKTLTDRGCLGWFDDGVELQDGSKVSDTKALLAIKKHPTKKTIYGAPMLDYKTFPKVSYKKAEINGKLLPRDKNDEAIGGQDGIEMTSMFSIMIGAIKELTLENKTQQAQIDALTKRIEKLEAK